MGGGGGGIVGFGAEQVILVRDDSARKEVFDYVEKQALVLTILECKGLEFQVVKESYLIHFYFVYYVYFLMADVSFCRMYCCTTFLALHL